jgi:hypothetical protein
MGGGGWRGWGGGGRAMGIKQVLGNAWGVHVGCGVGAPGEASVMRHGGLGEWRPSAPTLSNTSKRASKVTMEMSAMEGAGPRK